MDMPADYESPVYYEEISIEDQADIKTILSLKPFYEDLAVNFENTDSVTYDEVRQVSEQHYTVVLYYRNRCPYCVKVINYLNFIGESITMKDTGTDSEAYRELVQATKKTQVPCLFIDGKPHHESAWIINWLGAHKGKY